MNSEEVHTHNGNTIRIVGDKLVIVKPDTSSERGWTEIIELYFEGGIIENISDYDINIKLGGEVYRCKMKLNVKKGSLQSIRWYDFEGRLHNLNDNPALKHFYTGGYHKFGYYTHGAFIREWGEDDFGGGYEKDDVGRIRYDDFTEHPDGSLEYPDYSILPNKKMVYKKKNNIHR